LPAPGGAGLLPDRPGPGDGAAFCCGYFTITALVCIGGLPNFLEKSPKIPGGQGPVWSLFPEKLAGEIACVKSHNFTGL